MFHSIPISPRPETQACMVARPAPLSIVITSPKRPPRHAEAQRAVLAGLLILDDSDSCEDAEKREGYLIVFETRSVVLDQ